MTRSFDPQSYQEGAQKLAERAAEHFRDMARQARHRQAAMAYEEAAVYIERAAGIRPLAGP